MTRRNDSKTDISILCTLANLILTMIGIIFIIHISADIESFFIEKGIRKIDSINDLYFSSDNKIVYNKQLCTKTDTLSSKSIYSQDCNIVIYKCNDFDYVAQYKNNQTLFRSMPFYVAKNQDVIHSTITSKLLLSSPSYNDCNCRIEEIDCNSSFKITSCLYIFANGLQPTYYVRNQIIIKDTNSIYYEHSEYVNATTRYELLSSNLKFEKIRAELISQECKI